MRIMSILISSIVSLAAVAMPKVGDLAVYDGLYEGSGGGSMPFEQTLLLTELSGPSAVVESTLIFDEQSRQQKINLKTEQLLSSDVVEYVLSECATQGGALETVTVPAGQFETCAIAQGPVAKVWIGKVPFGIVKQVSLDEVENIITIELKDFVFGK